MAERREIVARALGDGSSCDDGDGLGFDGDASVSDGTRARVRKFGLRMLAMGERRPRMEVSILSAWIACRYVFLSEVRW